MGCDIHVYVEHKVNGVWEYFDAPPGSGFGSRNKWDLGRNYMLFGILAGVRNHDVLPISEPRGLPEDCCKQILICHDDWGPDAHSASYLTIAELQFAAKIPFKMQGYFEIKDFVSYKETGKPEHWFSKYVPFGYEEISNEEMEKYIENVAFLNGEKFVTKMTWDMPYENIGEYFWEDILPKMAEIDPNPENVRMVFWFDN